MYTLPPWLDAAVSELTTVALFCVIFGIIFAFMKSKKPSNFPPGPKGVPFIGNGGIVCKNKHLHHTISALAKQYGPIMGLQLGWYPAVVLSDYQLIKQAFEKQPEVFSNRPTHIAFTKLTGLDSGLANSNGAIWKYHRALALTSLKNFGLGKSSMEVVIQEETSVLLNYMDERCGKPFHIQQIIQKVSSNVMCSLLFGERFPHDSEQFETLLRDIDALVAGSGIQIGMFVMLPYLIPTALLNPDMLYVLARWRSIQWFLQQKIQEHNDSFVPGNIRDFLDVFLDAQRDGGKQQEESSWLDAVNSYLVNGITVKDRNLFVTIMDLFIAGSETVATTLDWGILYLLHNPQLQHKCRQEIVQKIGSRKPCLKDREHLTYIEATISEMQRLASSVPHAASHCTSTALTFEGYHLPANTIVIPNFYSIHRDPQLWGDPEVFRPERFLDSDGKLMKPPYFMPFSTGKRMCFGENLARSELFLFLTGMLQRFELTAEDTSTLPPIHGGIMGGVILKPGPFKIVVNPC